jgi:hypothetical protein
MPSAQNQIQIVDTHETSETLAITRLQRVGYQINRTLLIFFICLRQVNSQCARSMSAVTMENTHE